MRLRRSEPRRASGAARYTIPSNCLVALLVLLIAPHTLFAVDPSFTCEKKLTASDPSTFATFGEAIAADGDTVVVGAQNKPAAYIFVKAGSTWSQQQELTATGAGTNDFGEAVAISGETVVVGFPGDTDAGFDSGSAFVYVRTGTTWNLQQKLIGSDTAPADSFGLSVAIDGDTIVVGSTGSAGFGAAYVFVRSGTSWTEQQKLTASDAALGDLFGYTAAIKGETAVIGNPFDDNAGGVDAGSVYVFVRSGTTWAQQQKLTAGDGAQLDEFGRSVSIDGDTAAVGVLQHKEGGVDTGAAYVFARTGTTWAQQQEIISSDAADGDGFGSEVSVRGDTLVAGSPGDEGGAGSAYVLTRTGSVWTQQQKLTASDAHADDRFGTSVAVEESRVAVGAGFADVGGFDRAGAAYVYEASTGPIITDASAAPNVLWPPNHKLIPVVIGYTVEDSCDPAPVCSLSVSSSEGGSGDWTVVDAHDVLLRADRSGSGPGRVYTITVTCTDSQDSSSSATTTVTVPHDQGN